MKRLFILPLMALLLVGCGRSDYSSFIFSSSSESSIQSESSSSISSSDSSSSSYFSSSEYSSSESSSSMVDSTVTALTVNREDSDIDALIFYPDEVFTTSGLVVEATYSNGSVKNVVNECTFTNTDIYYDDVEKGHYVDVLHNPSGMTTQYWISIIIPSEQDLEVTSISISDVTIEVGKSTTIVPTIKPSETYWKEVTYSISNTDIAEVDEEGVIIAKAIGTTTIRATSKKFNKVYDEAAVTVTEASNDHGLLTISQINALDGNVPFKDETFYLSKQKVTFKAKALDVISYIKTSKDDGGNSKPTKILMADSTGYILASSSVESNDLGANAKKYLESPQLGSTYYTVTGTLARYRGVLEVQVESYSWSQTANVTYDLNELSESVSSISDMKTYIKTINYNTKGIAAGKLIKASLYFVSKANDNGAYLFQDENGDLLNVYSPYGLSFIANKKYELIGLLSLNNYKMSLRAISSSILTGEKEYDIKTKASETTIKNLYDIKEPSSLSDDYINQTSMFYKASCYVGCYEESGKYDFCFADSYKTGYTIASSKANVISMKGVWSSNENYWNVSASNIERGILNEYCLDLYEGIDETTINEFKVTIYFTLDLLRTDTGVKDTPAWKIYIQDSLNDHLGIDEETTKESIVFARSTTYKEIVDNRQKWVSGNITIFGDAGYPSGTDFIKLNKNGGHLTVNSTKSFYAIEFHYKGTYCLITNKNYGSYDSLSKVSNTVYLLSFKAVTNSYDITLDSNGDDVKITELVLYYK